MLTDAVETLEAEGFRTYVEDGRLHVTDSETGETAAYFPELGSWFAMQDGRLIQFPAMQDGTPQRDTETVEVATGPGLVGGEVTAFNEAPGWQIAILRHHFGDLPRSCFAGR